MLTQVKAVVDSLPCESLAWQCLSRSEKIGLIESAGTVASAVVTIGAAWIAFRALAMQPRIARTERRYVVFRTLLLDPASRALVDLERDAGDFLARGLGDVDALITANAGVNEIRQRTERLVLEFKELVEPANTHLLLLAAAWEDVKLSESLERAFEDLIDPITLACAAKQLGKNTDDFRQKLRLGIGRILGAIVHYEIEPKPSLRDLLKRYGLQLVFVAILLTAVLLLARGLN